MRGVFAEMQSQARKHGPFTGDSELGRMRLALACLEDELVEALEAWREERSAEGWPNTLTEVRQIAALAMRILDQFEGGQ